MSEDEAAGLAREIAEAAFYSDYADVAARIQPILARFRDRVVEEAQADAKADAAVVEDHVAFLQASWAKAEADRDTARAEVGVLRERLEVGGKHAAALLDLSCADGLYWSWSPTERAAWDWLKFLARPDGSDDGVGYARCEPDP